MLNLDDFSTKILLHVWKYVYDSCKIPSHGHCHASWQLPFCVLVFTCVQALEALYGGKNKLYYNVHRQKYFRLLM